MDKFYEVFSRCNLCGHNCGIDRTKENSGFCNSTDEIYISSYNLHFGEEPPLSGKNGSGTIFFTGCNLNCVFCQNYPISQLRNGRKISQEKLVSIMLELENKRAHNINFVSPTHYSPIVADAILRARRRGLKIPIVYNCGGYDSIEALKLLDGLVDVYMPDSKYGNENGEKYSGAPGYFNINKIAVREMHRQVGDLKLDASGIAVSGLLVRHLVLPDNLAGSFEVLDFIANELSKKTYVSIMSQYHPAHRSDEFSELARRLNEREYMEVVDYARKLGLENAYIQYL